MPMIGQGVAKVTPVSMKSLGPEKEKNLLLPNYARNRKEEKKQQRNGAAPCTGPF